MRDIKLVPLLFVRFVPLPASRIPPRDSSFVTTAATTAATPAGGNYVPGGKKGPRRRRRRELRFSINARFSSVRADLSRFRGSSNPKPSSGLGKKKVGKRTRSKGDV